MNINELTSRLNIRIFGLIGSKEYSIRELAEAAKCSPGKAHAAVKILLKHDMVKTKKDKNRVMVIANKKNPIYIKLKSLINIYKIISSRAYKRLAKEGAVGIYGSFAKGEDSTDSDIDLWIYTEKKEIEIRHLIRKMEKSAGKRISLMMLNKNKLNELKQKDKEMFTRLRLTSVQLNGDIFE